MHLYLIRHGQSVENTQPWDGKNTNSPLTDLGNEQARRLAAHLKGRITFDHLYVSSMLRTRQTAAYLEDAMSIEAVVDDRLREVGNAYPDGKAFPNDALPRYILGVWGSLQPYSPVTDGGENWMHFRARVGSFVEWAIQLLDGDHAEHRTAVVCHGGVIEGVFEHVFQKGPVSPLVVHSYNTGVTHLEFNPMEGMPSWKLYYHNRTNHLNDDQIT